MPMLEVEVELEPVVTLGRADLDDDHHLLFERLQALHRSDDAEFGAQLARFEAEAQRHFAHEDQLMEGADFATRECHVDEHAAVLASLAEVRGLVASGGLAVGRRLVRELERWLPEHIGALDLALAKWLFQRANGGARVMLLRRVVAGTDGSASWERGSRIASGMPDRSGMADGMTG